VWRGGVASSFRCLSREPGAERVRRVQTCGVPLAGFQSPRKPGRELAQGRGTAFEAPGSTRLPAALILRHSPRLPNVPS